MARLETTTAPITISPKKTALVIIDMRNTFFSSAMFGATHGEGHTAEELLLSTTTPVAHKVEIQIIHITWDISEKELTVLPPVIFRIFRFYDIKNSGPRDPKEAKGSWGVRDDIGDRQFSNGSKVAAGRMLMRDQWNTALHKPMQRSFDDSQKTHRPDVRFHKSRLSGF